MSLLERKVLSVLLGPAVARIRFRFPIANSHVTIAPQTFHRVAHAIRSGQVLVRAPTDLAAGVAAQYNDVARTRADATVVSANTLEISAVTGRFDEATVVHESLHYADLRIMPRRCVLPRTGVQSRRRISA
jgi:hypothetical protein